MLKSPGSDMILELNWYPHAYRFGGKSGLDHVAYQVGDVDQAFSSLTRKYKGPIAPFNEGKWRLAFIEDPDGNWIELGEKLRIRNPAKRKRKLIRI